MRASMAKQQVSNRTEKIYSDIDTLTSYLVLSHLKVHSLTIFPQMDKFNKKNINVNMKKKKLLSFYLHGYC